jgi:RecB family exonuclease
VITPRRIRLHRAPDLFAFRSTLSAWIAQLSVEDAGDAAIIIPTRAAAEQLRRTVEHNVLRGDRQTLVWPLCLTRRDLYDELSVRLSPRPAMLSAFEREVLLGAASRAVLAQGLELPYELRPALVAEMLRLYDHIRRLGRSVADFERNFRNELEREQDTDRGAFRLLQQTVFLAAAYTSYEEAQSASGRLDEHRLRDLLSRTLPARPLQRIVLTVADRVTDPDGLWPADFDLLTRIPDLRQIDVLCTEATLAAGYLERLYGAFPELHEERAGAARTTVPVMIVPPAQPDATRDAAAVVCFTHRDREEELLAVARRLKRQRRDGRQSPLDRTALVVRRPLPYLYLARDVFGDAAIPFETLDTMPLAAEPYAAAVDVVLDVVATDFTRGSLMALLRSPHFQLDREAAVATTRHEWRVSVNACDGALAEARFLGGLDRLKALLAEWAAAGAPAHRDARRRHKALPALRAVVAAVTPLRQLAASRPLVTQINLLLEWLTTFDHPEAAPGVVDSRRQRVRGAVVGALAALRDAYALHDPTAEGDVAALTAALRRWIGAQTFALPSGEPGLQLIDAQAARYGDFDDVQLVGLVDGEWPERTNRNVLYPTSLLAQLEPAPSIGDPAARDRQALQAAKAAFRELVTSASTSVRLSTFLLENDSVVEPSLLVADVPALGLQSIREEPDTARVTYSEALALSPPRPDVIPEPAAMWAHMRAAADTRDRARLRGDAGPWHMPRISVSRLELFLNCPFKFFASSVLRLEEEPEDQAIQTPLERGRFLHELWERFFAEWQRRGHGRIDQNALPAARVLFTEICEEEIARLSPVEAALERHKLLGSAISPGIAHRVFTMEAGRTTPLVERLLEFALEGEFELRSKDGRTRRIVLNAKTDRIDILEGRRLRVIDYKSKSTPDPKVALQLPIYAHLARERLQQSRGGEWVLDEAMYVSFEGDRPIVAMRPAKGESLDTLVADAEHRLLDALDRIAEGHFPPQPLKKSLCGPCGYKTVCRLEIQMLEGGGGIEGGGGQGGAGGERG